MRLAEALTAYVAQRKQEGLSPYTLKAYGLQIGLLIRDLGDPEASDVTTEMLRGHLAPHVDRLKPASMAHKVRAIRGFFKWMHEDAEIIPRNPALKIREPKLGQRIPKALDVDELELMRDACRSAFERALVETFYSTGCRVGELHLVNRASIDWDHRTIRVHGKGNKERDVYLGSKAVLRLRQYLKERDDQNPALFATERNPHRRMSIHQLQYVMKRIAKRTGLGDRVSPHVLRNTMATQMHNRGASIDVLQSLLGHDDPKTTRIYAAMSGKRRHEAFERYFPD